MWALMWLVITAEVQQQPVCELFTVAEEVVCKAWKAAAVKATQVDANTVKQHSLRAGGATDTEELSLTLTEAVFMGAWRSSTVLADRRGVT
jgi:hypothetical protein